MTTDRELMQQALEALQYAAAHLHRDDTSPVVDAITTLRERLAQPEPQRTHWEGCEEVHPECRKPEQEPVAWMYVNMDGECEQIEYLEDEPMPDDPFITPLYTTPPRREWVGLTDEEIAAVGREEWVGWPSYDDEFTHIFRLLEAKLKEKNA